MRADSKIFDSLRLITGAVLVYAGSRYNIRCDNSRIQPIPLKSSIGPQEFMSVLNKTHSNHDALFVLRDGLCTCFMQHTERIFKKGFRHIVAYDRPSQIFQTEQIQWFNFEGLSIERRKSFYRTEVRALNFSFGSSSPNVRVGPIISITEIVRQRLHQYSFTTPSWLVALDMMESNPYLAVPVHAIARVIREERRQDTIVRFPMLSELVVWIIKEKQLDMSKRESIDTLLQHCGEYSAINSYFNRTNLIKAVEKVRDLI